MTEQQWIVDQANFDEFKKRLETNTAFAEELEALMWVVDNEPDPYGRMTAYWDHNEWIHKNGHVDVKDALWDWIEGRR